jgi:hypothetical protein
MRKIAGWMNSPEIPPTPLCQRGAGGISEDCFQFAHNFINKSMGTEIQQFAENAPTGHCERSEAISLLKILINYQIASSPKRSSQ